MNNFKKMLVLLFAILSVSILTSCEDCKFDGIAPDDIPTGKVGTDYSTVFRERATACSPSRVYIWMDSGNLPPGLTLYPNGELRGKISANAEAKVYNFTIKMEVCFSGSNSAGFSNCSTLIKGYALKVDPQ